MFQNWFQMTTLRTVSVCNIYQVCNLKKSKLASKLSVWRAVTFYLAPQTIDGWSHPAQCSAGTQNQLKMSVGCIMTTASVVFLKSNTEWTVLPAWTLSSQCSQFPACLRREKTSRKRNFKTFSEQDHLQRTLWGLQREMKFSLVLVCHVFQNLF